jgi:anti-sigma B factor antagonist
MQYGTDGMTYKGSGEYPILLLEFEIRQLSHQDFRISTLNGLPVVSTPAELDLLNKCQLTEAILTAAGASGTAGVVVDMTGLVFMDCSAVGALVRAYRHLAEEGIELRIAATHPKARWFLALFGTDSELPLFRVFDTLPEAVTAPSVSAGRDNWARHPQAA